MKTIKIIYKATGENSGTYTAHCSLENFTGDITEKCTRFMNWDCDIPVECDLYRISTVTVPTWMDAETFIRHEIELKYAAGLAGDIVYNFTEQQFFNFIKLGEKWKYFYGWAVERAAKAKKPNPFQDSILDQFNKWLNGESKHGSPLSPAQWEAATRYTPLYEAGRISTRLYYSR